MLYENFSVLIPTYKNDDSQALKQALTSLINQALIPTEIVLVVDGPISNDTENTISVFKEAHGEKLKIVRLEINQGLGNALNIGLQHCIYELVARMDSDDIADYDRFKIQLAYFKEFPETTILGGYIREFKYVVGDTDSIRTALLGNNIKRFGSIRCPLNHPTVMFKKSAIIAVGSYKEIFCLEDYYLWLRLLKHNYIIKNVPVILTNYRFSEKTILKRQGTKYAFNELKFFIRCYKEKLLSLWILIFHFFITFPARLLPIKILNLLYKKMLRVKQ